MDKTDNIKARDAAIELAKVHSKRCQDSHSLRPERSILLNHRGEIA